MTDKDNKRCFVTNRSGNVFIYDISLNVPSLIHTMTTQEKGAIRGLFMDPAKNYVFTAGFDDGEVGVFDIVQPGKERFGK